MMHSEPVEVQVKVLDSMYIEQNTTKAPTVAAGASHVF